MLPMKVTDYAEEIEKYTDNIIERFGVQMQERGLAGGIGNVLNVLKCNYMYVCMDHCQHDLISKTRH